MIRAFSSLGQWFVTQIAIGDIFCSTSTTSWLLLLQALGFNNFAPLRRRPRNVVTICMRKKIPAPSKLLMYIFVYIRVFLCLHPSRIIFSFVSFLGWYLWQILTDKWQVPLHMPPNQSAGAKPHDPRILLRPNVRQNQQENTDITTKQGHKHAPNFVPAMLGVTATAS